MWAVIAWGAAITAFGVTTFIPSVGFAFALLFLAAAGAADAISAVFRSTILQVSVPDRLRGRLSAIHLAVVTGGPRVGDMEAAAVAALTSAQVSVVSGGALCILGVGVTALLFPQLVRYDASQPHEQHESAAIEALAG